MGSEPLSDRTSGRGGSEPKCCFSVDQGAGRFLECAGRLRPREEVHVDASDTACSRTRRSRSRARRRPPVARRARQSRSAKRLRPAPLPRRTLPLSARRSSPTSPIAYTPGKPRLEASSGSRARNRLRSSRWPGRRRGRGAWERRGRGRRASRCRRLARRRGVPGRASSRGARGRTRCRARRTRRPAHGRCPATEGPGSGNGITKEISQSSRTPRAER